MSDDIKDIKEANKELHDLICNEFIPACAAKYLKGQSPVLLVVFSTIEGEDGCYEFKVALLSERSELDVINEVKNTKNFHSIIAQFRFQDMNIHHAGEVIGHIVMTEGETFKIILASR